MTASAMTDAQLVAAYVEDARDSFLGVDFYLASEMEARGLRDHGSAALTDAGGRIAAEVVA